MQHIHMKDIKDELKSEPTWAYVYAAFFLGMVVFAVVMGGFHWSMG
jgi:hypothetical protein